MDYIETATGKKLYTDYVASIPAPQYLFIRILRVTRETLEAIFGYPEETQTIKWGQYEFSGFTTLVNIADEGTAYKITLRKGS